MAGVKGMPSRPATRWWGKVRGKIANLKDWSEHDHSTSWDDGGEAEKLGKDVAERTRAIIAQQTREAVADYAQDAEFALTTRGTDLAIAVNMASNGSRLIIQVPLSDLVNAAISDAYQQAASPQSQEFLSVILKTCQDMMRLRQALLAPATNTQQAAPEKAVA